MPRSQNELELCERGDASGFRFVKRPGQPAHRQIIYFISQFFREIELSFNQGPTEHKPRRKFADSSKVTVLPSKAGSHVMQLEIPCVERRFGFNLRQATGKPAVFGGVRST